MIDPKHLFHAAAHRLSGTATRDGEQSQSVGPHDNMARALLNSTGFVDRATQIVGLIRPI